MNKWKKIDKIIKYMLPVVFILLITYFYVSFISNPYNINKFHLEIMIIGYFIIELIVKFMLASNITSFLKKNWLKIVLVLPFFRLLRLVQIPSYLLPYLRYIPYLQKLLKIPKIVKVVKSMIFVLLFKRSIIDRRKNENEEKST